MDKYKCTECGYIGDEDSFEETEVGCEDCGSHPALKCPNCGEYIDLVSENPYEPNS